MGRRVQLDSEETPGPSRNVPRTQTSSKEGKRTEQNGNVKIVRRQDRQDARSPQPRQEYPRADLTPYASLTPVGINTDKDFTAAFNTRMKRFLGSMESDYQLTLQDELGLIEEIVKEQNGDYGVIDPDSLYSLLRKYRVKIECGKEDWIDSHYTEFYDASEGQRSTGLFIRWSQDRPLIDLMEKWIKANVGKMNRWKRFKRYGEEGVQKNLAVDLVIVPSAQSKDTIGSDWVRAYAMDEKEGEEKVEVLTVDRGQTYDVPLGKVYSFNHDLFNRKKLRHFSFFIDPEGLKYPEGYQGKSQWGLLIGAYRAFLMKYKPRIKCCIQSIPKGKKEVSVKLTGFRSSSRGEVTEDFQVFFDKYVRRMDDVYQAMTTHSMAGELVRTIKEAKMEIEKLQAYTVDLIRFSKDAQHLYVYCDPTGCFNRLLDEMQDDYAQKYKKLEHVKPVPGRACAWFSYDDQTWYRGVVLQNFCTDDTTIVNLWLADWGETRPVPVQELRHLHKKYGFAATVLKVQLAHLEINNRVAVKDFMKRFRDDQLSCTPIAVEVNAQPGSHGQIEFPSRSYSVIFRILKGPPTTVQAELWKAGLALPNGPVVSNFIKKSKVTYYRSSSLETELKSTFDTPISFTPVRSETLARCRQSVGGGAAVNLNAGDFPPAIEECMSHVFISSAGTGPMDFYVQSILHVDELNQMEDDLLRAGMAKALKKIDNPQELVAGTLVAVDAPVPNEKRSLKRMMILCKSEGLEDCFDGLLIDHGEVKIGVSMKSMKWPPECIKAVRPMCQRVHLEMPPGFRPACLSGYDYRCCEFWKVFIKFWQEQDAAYWLWTRKEKHTVVILDEFQQQLAYDIEEEDWIPGPLAKRGWLEALNKIWLDSGYRHPILSNFYTSVGVLVSYHEFSEQAVKFLDMMDFLVKRNFVAQKK